MKLEVHIDIEGTKQQVWKVISDIEGSVDTITGINNIEVLEQGSDGLKGLKWRETRTMFGKEATEVMWITDEVVNDHYMTRAESHGMVYVTRLGLSDVEGKTRLTMAFEGEAQKLSSKLMSIVGFFFKSATKKALMQDLEDIKTKVEAGS